MTLNIAFQMDPLETLDMAKDSTLLLAYEAKRRGYNTYHYTPNDLSWNEGTLTANACPFSISYDDNHFQYGEMKKQNLKEFDLILMRQDPPFNMNYIMVTHLLEHVMNDTLVLNDPIAVRNAPEKMLVTHFSELMPPTLISKNKDEIQSFHEKHEDIIVKPLNGYAGHNIFRVEKHSENLSAVISALDQLYNEPHMIQKYIPDIRKGDKRIILFEGQPKAALIRVPLAGNARANFSHGGLGEKTELTKRDLEICETIAPALKDKNLTFVGIDVIGNYITEINVTCPTGLVHIKKLYDHAIECDLWDIFERKIQDFKATKT